ncbi:MAG: hypothetical protein GX837_02855 [Methanomicrobiales archaeon]|nr:hypothetical protein [Methanomicrobiales archaeon]
MTSGHADLVVVPHPKSKINSNGMMVNILHGAAPPISAGFQPGTTEPSLPHSLDHLAEQCTYLIHTRGYEAWAL